MAAAHTAGERPVPDGDTLALVESPVQLLNVLEWAYAHGGLEWACAHGGLEWACPHGGHHAPAPDHAPTVVVLPPRDAMTRGQLRRMAQLARDAGLRVRWEEARGDARGPLRTLRALARPLRRAARVVVGDPFSRYVQLLLTFTRRCGEVVVVDDGTATMAYLAQLADGKPLVRWHRAGDGGLRGAAFAPLAARARSRLVPGPGRRVEVFSTMPVAAPDGVRVTANRLAWTRARFGPPTVAAGADLVGCSLVETGVVDADRYLRAVCALVAEHQVTRYFAHRRESPGKLARIAEAAGVAIVRPDLPLELVARRGPIGRSVVSLPSTVVHTLPLVLADTPVSVTVCEVDSSWFTARASARARDFLTRVVGTASRVRRLPGPPPSG